MSNVIPLFSQGTSDSEDTEVLDAVVEEEVVERPSLSRSARTLLMMIGAALVVGALIARSILTMPYALSPSFVAGVAAVAVGVLYVFWRNIRDM